MAPKAPRGAFALRLEADRRHRDHQRERVQRDELAFACRDRAAYAFERRRGVLQARLADQRDRLRLRGRRLRHRIVEEIDRASEPFRSAGHAAGELGHAELEQDVAARVRRWRLGERAAQQRDGGRRRTLGDRRAGGAQQVGARRRIATTGREQEMRRDPLLRRAELAQHARSLAVRDVQRMLAHVARDGVADQAVPEAQALAGLEQIGADKRVGRGGGARERKAGEPGGVPELSAGTQDDDRSGDRRGIRRQASQAAQDRRRDTTHTRPRVAQRRRALLVEGGERRVEQERIAAARRQAPVDELGPRHDPRTRHDERGHGRSTQRCQHELAPSLQDRLERIRARRGFPRAPRQQHHHRQLIESPRDVREPAQRRGIHPLRIVEHEHDRLALGEAGEQPCQAVHRCELRVDRR